MIRRTFALLTLFIFGSIQAHETNLDEYIRIGLENNLALKQKNFMLQKSISSLREAQGMFMPRVNIEARYSRAGGGRLIEIPVGDLMNPVYQTLNDLLESVGQPPLFPTDLPNDYIPFLREKEHETKVRIVQPVFQPRILHNYKMKKELRDIEENARLSFARQLVSDMKTAYYNYLKTIQIQNLLNRTKDLLQENIRVNESLFRNDKVTIAAVYRAQAELHELEQARAEADKNRILARSTFNFLLNRPLEQAIIADSTAAPDPIPLFDDSGAESIALQNREELRQMENAVDLSKHQVGLFKSSYLPGIAVVADIGFQGEKYRFTEKDDYWMASMIFEWNLFSGFQARNRVQQAKIEKRYRSSQLEELREKIRLQTSEAVQNVLVARKAITAADRRRESARRTYLIIDRKYREGMASQIEFIDARTTMTKAEINYIVAVYDFYIRKAEQERILATYPLDI